MQDFVHQPYEFLLSGLAYTIYWASETFSTSSCVFDWRVHIPGLQVLVNFKFCPDPDLRCSYMRRCSQHCTLLCLLSASRFCL